MKEPKPIDLDEWRAISLKLKKEYENFDELFKHCKKIFGRYFTLGGGETPKHGDAITIEPLWVYEGVVGGKHDRVHPGKDIKVYSLNKNGSLKIVDFSGLVEELTPVVLSHLDTEKTMEIIVKDTLNDQEPGILLDLKERLFKKDQPKKKVKVTTPPRCVEMKIGGKPGAPLSLMLRE